MPTRTTALDSPEAEVSTIRRELYHAVPGALARTLLLTYTMLAAAFALALGTGSALGYAVGFALVVAVQTRLAMFMHEGAHWLVDANKTVNDRLANWLAAFPIGMTVERYRASHLQHHARLGTADDPDFTALCLPPVEQGVGASVLACLTGWRHVKLVQKYLGERDAEAGPSRAPSSASSVIGRIGSQGLLFGIGVLAGQWWAYFVLWLLPLATFGVLINEVRSVVEHTPLLPRGADGASMPLTPITRTVRAGWFARNSASSPVAAPSGTRRPGRNTAGASITSISRCATNSAASSAPRVAPGISTPVPPSTTSTASTRTSTRPTP